MDHENIRHKLSEYLDGSVSPEERSIIEAHLTSCAECSDALRELRKTIEHLHAVDEVEPPAWMTQKIMARVRAVEADERRSILRQLFDFFAVSRALRVVAVLFLTVTAYYIYVSIHPAVRYPEATMDTMSEKGSSKSMPEATKEKAPEIVTRREKKVAQEPGYKALDMKDEYERPAPPVPERAEAPALARKTERPAPRSMMAAPAAPSSAAGQAAGATATRADENLAKRESSEKTKELRAFNAADQESTEITSVTEHFMNDDLPETLKVRGLQVLTMKVPDDLAGLGWLREMAAYRVPCSRRYLVDVNVPGTSLKYLYCYDRGRVRRLGVFEQISGVWMERK